MINTIIITTLIFLTNHSVFAKDINGWKLSAHYSSGGESQGSLNKLSYRNYEDTAFRTSEIAKSADKLRLGVDWCAGWLCLGTLALTDRSYYKETIATAAWGSANYEVKTSTSELYLGPAIGLNLPHGMGVSWSPVMNYYYQIESQVRFLNGFEEQAPTPNQYKLRKTGSILHSSWSAELWHIQWQLLFVFTNFDIKLDNADESINLKQQELIPYLGFSIPIHRSRND